ncbi:hypothetical protein AXF42_Ash018346 [Apostasia shenzhenica]|uniref:Uncharacterized protein n=1 Tax=Apostasia shenzhenica TaxID=1088818 RepID=A0A2H9ZR72_9ASPA|nr:hypothetical protein AXF42_Ash018346 [Apostasia shenzhenica]
MEETKEGSVGEIVIDQELLLLRIVVGSEPDDVRGVKTADEIHVLVEILSGAGICVLEPLHLHHFTVFQRRLVHSADVPLSEHLRRRPEEHFQLEPSSSVLSPAATSLFLSHPPSITISGVVLLLLFSLCLDEENQLAPSLHRAGVSLSPPSSFFSVGYSLGIIHNIISG